MRSAARFGMIVATLAVVACGRDKGIRCEDPATYAATATIAPIRVPDDLTVPDESDALLVPADAASDAAAIAPGACLESPPEYFEDGALR